MKAPNNSAYEEVNLRVCCQHGKPCARSKQQRLFELGNFSSSVRQPVPPIEEENAYENLDPSYLPKKDNTKKEQFFLAEGKPIVVNRLPKEEKTSKRKKKEESTSGDSTEINSSERKQKKKKKRPEPTAKSVYLGVCEWRRAERKLRGAVALYHLADDPETPLFLLQRKQHGLRHFRIVQRCLEVGTFFLAEDGSAYPKCDSLDALVKHYKDKSSRK